MLSEGAYIMNCPNCEGGELKVKDCGHCGGIGRIVVNPVHGDDGEICLDVYRIIKN